MAEITSSESIVDINTDVATSILKVNGNGWDIKLFEQSNISECICKCCKSVCANAVELACDHDDIDIFLACETCLQSLIKDKNNKCPLNGHDNPSFVSNRFARRKILKANVICPFSSKYRTLTEVTTNDNGMVINTIGNDEKEGSYAQQPGNDMCDWKGTFRDLITTHISECLQKTDALYENFKIQQLVGKNKELSNEIVRQNVVINTLKTHNDDLKKQLYERDEIITKQKKQIQFLTQKSKLLQSSSSNVAEVKYDTTEKDVIGYGKLKQTALEFCIPSVNKKILLKMSGNVLKYKGGILRDYSWCKFGSLLTGNDNVMVYFEVGAGMPANYGFGFASKKCNDWNVDWPRHTIAVDGSGSLRIKNEFQKNNNAKAIKRQLECVSLFEKSRGKNIIGVSVEMNSNKGEGWIWSQHDWEHKVKFNLPKEVFIIVMMSGWEDKTLTVTNVKQNS